MISVYVASRLPHGDMLREMFAQPAWSFVKLTSRWVDMIHLEDTASPADFTWCWMIDENDVREAQCLIIYGEKDDILRGALVEAGMAIALGIPVLAVGYSPSFFGWVNHPLVIRLNTLEQANLILQEWERGRSLREGPVHA